MKRVIYTSLALLLAGTAPAQKAIDLGLSVLWADCNVGAERPEEPGIYVAWGELSPKSEYLMTNYQFCLGDFSTPTKYFAFDPERVSTVPDGKTILEPEDDVATVVSGSDWRSPTNAEITELATQCSWQWAADGDAPGYRVTGPSGNSIFLPAAGIWSGSKLMYDGDEGYYWSSESMYVADEVYCLRFTPRLVAHSNFKSTERWHGSVVRAVYDKGDKPDTKALAEWQAGQTVSAEAVAAFGGVDKCFAAEPVPDGVWTRMQGKTYKKNPYIGRDDLRHIRALHWDYDNRIHIGEMVCNKRIADRVVKILRQLYDAKYPIQRMLLPDVYNADDETQMRANNTSCFCYRAVAKTAKLSKHARGLAVDINTLYNPYYKDRANGSRYVQPATAVKYCDRTKSFPYKIDRRDLCYRLFTEAGFEWGGDWKSCKDFQHFELIE